MPIMYAGNVHHKENANIKNTTTTFVSTFFLNY